MYHFVKRTLDCTVAATALVLFAPVMAIVAVVIRCSIGSPIIFRQVRPGQNETLFACLKFRTMRNEQESSTGRRLTESERMTPVGMFLRRSSLDELPQLWNILRGDMSLVGPRPLLTSYLPYYTQEERRRHLV